MRDRSLFGTDIPDPRETGELPWVVPKDYAPEPAEPMVNPWKLRIVLGVWIALAALAIGSYVPAMITVFHGLR